MIDNTVIYSGNRQVKQGIQNTHYTIPAFDTNTIDTIILITHDTMFAILLLIL